MGDRYNIFSQMEHLQSKYVGTGHADTTKWEWLTNQHRDTLASYLGNVVNHRCLIGNRFHVTLRIVSPIICKQC